jgi:hypothetical protein
MISSQIKSKTLNSFLLGVGHVGDVVRVTTFGTECSGKVG